MKLTVLGTGTIAFSPQRSCAGYYVEAGNARILMDCGAGTTRRLAEFGIAWQQITHVVLSHFHIDHHADLPTIIFAGRYGMLPPRRLPLTIVGPVGTADLLDRLALAYGDWVKDPGYELSVIEIAPGAGLDLLGATLECCKVPHTPESVAYSITEGARRVVYSGDTGFDAAFAGWARGCDALLLECSLPQAMAIPEHLTPEQCGEMAALAQPGLLVLTHLYPPVEQVDIVSIVTARFAGSVAVAHDGWRLDLQE